MSDNASDCMRRPLSFCRLANCTVNLFEPSPIINGTRPVVFITSPDKCGGENVLYLTCIKAHVKGRRRCTSDFRSWFSSVKARVIMLSGDDRFCRVNTIPECEGRTDRQNYYYIGLVTTRSGVSYMAVINVT